MDGEAAAKRDVGVGQGGSEGEEETGKEKGPDESGPSLMLAERTGLEPATPDVTGRYSNQLNYHSVLL
ncbi:hypothetical protein BN2497_6905 [Janthinobacterium sp. CG23_2]|nr:hypothetical protein BN2497_6905 [Janthinobacterium sp. CG23_2]CUU29850.1 hypothetical protein BN3177_6905 [Janthinobacterium sp. CG23_2]